ncbi:MAG TPA: 2-C-methyl-D-erythritol 2,4-cyclodiphosphate synthase, partial [Helicobacteraceae bacterium]|nr:2-C-methyl-D-erythritol 2,4-cyclodiphosphate synthase [Helicobacteraceae bacterium]
SRHFILGSQNADKITHLDDIKKLSCLNGPEKVTLMGNGFDVHAFEPGRKMMLAGVEIPDVDYGFKAHSDGDVAIHALIDALLGAAGLGDIGMLFPDTSHEYKDIDSKILLTRCVTTLHHLGYEIINADVTIAAEAPRLGNYKKTMRETLAPLLHIDIARMNIKATTTEKLGFVGRKEGVAVIASATLNYFDWTK